MSAKGPHTASANTECNACTARTGEAGQRAKGRGVALVEFSLAVAAFFLVGLALGLIVGLIPGLTVVAAHREPRAALVQHVRGAADLRLELFESWHIDMSTCRRGNGVENTCCVCAREKEKEINRRKSVRDIKKTAEQTHSDIYIYIYTHLAVLRPSSCRGRVA